MKKIILGVIVLAAAGYSTLWFINKGKVEERAVALIEGQPLYDITYDDISVGGFPLSYKVSYKNPTLKPNAELMAALSADSPFGADFMKSMNASVTKAEGDIVWEIPPKFFGKTSTLRFPNKSTSVMPGINKEIITNYNDGAALSVTFKDSAFDVLIEKDVAEYKDIQLWLEQIIGFSYNDSGATSKDTAGNQYMKYSGTNIDISGHMDENAIGEFDMRMDIQDMDISDAFFADMEKMMQPMIDQALSQDPTMPKEKASAIVTEVMSYYKSMMGGDTVIDIGYKGPIGGSAGAGTEVDFDIREFHIEGKDFALDINGDVNLKDGGMMPMPSGGIDFKFTNYKNFINEHTNLYNNIVTAIDKNGNKNLAPKVVDAITSFAERLGDKSGDDLTVEVKIDGLSTKIGNFGVMELEKEFAPVIAAFLEGDDVSKVEPAAQHPIEIPANVSVTAPSVTVRAPSVSVGTSGVSVRKPSAVIRKPSATVTFP